MFADMAMLNAGPEHYRNGDKKKRFILDTGQARVLAKGD